jgi:hypothetical protein
MTLSRRIFDGDSRIGVSAQSPQSQEEKDHVSQTTQVDASESQEIEQTLPDDKLAEKGILDKFFKQPQPGSLLGKMKKGDMIGKHSGNNWEGLLGDIILSVQSDNIHPTLFLLARIALNQQNALSLSEGVQKLVRQEGFTEDQILSHLFDGKVKTKTDLGKYLKTLLPYHKDLLMKHSGLFSKLAGIT